MKNIKRILTKYIDFRVAGWLEDNAEIKTHRYAHPDTGQVLAQESCYSADDLMKALSEIKEEVFKDDESLYVFVQELFEDKKAALELGTILKQIYEGEK